MRICPSTRKPKGGMLGLVILAGCIVVICAIVGLVLCQIFFSNEDLQSYVDRIALTAAIRLNNDQSITKLNNLVCDNRELIFNSRQVLDDIVQNAPQLEPLAQQLVTEARDSAQIVEDNRKNWIVSATDQLKQIAIASEGEPGRTKFWFWSGQPQVTDMTLGSIFDCPSNVKEPDGNDDLLELDKKSNLLYKTAGFYSGDNIISLPGADGDLKFHVAVLPAPILDQTANPRLIKPIVFKGEAVLIRDGQPQLFTPDQMPCAVSVRVAMPVKSTLIRASSTEAASAFAVTRGGESREKLIDY